MQSHRDRGANQISASQELYLKHPLGASKVVALPAGTNKRPRALASNSALLFEPSPLAKNEHDTSQSETPQPALSSKTTTKFTINILGQLCTSPTPSSCNHAGDWTHMTTGATLLHETCFGCRR